MTTFFTSESVQQDTRIRYVPDRRMPFWMPFWKTIPIPCSLRSKLPFPTGSTFSARSPRLPVWTMLLCTQVVRDIGYVKHGYGFDADTCQITVDIHGNPLIFNMVWRRLILWKTEQEIRA